MEMFNEMWSIPAVRYFWIIGLSLLVLINGSYSGWYYRKEIGNAFRSLAKLLRKPEAVEEVE